jgi:hypothetical protein
MMKTMVNRLANAAPRALDSLIGANNTLDHQQEAEKKKKKMRERSCSFHLDLSELDLNNTSDDLTSSSNFSVSGGGSSTVGFSDLCSSSGISIGDEMSIVGDLLFGDEQLSSSSDYSSSSSAIGTMNTTTTTANDVSPSPN